MIEVNVTQIDTDEVCLVIGQHIETSLRVLVALGGVVNDALEGEAREIADAIAEDTIVEIVSGAVAIVTTAWTFIGYDIIKDNTDEPSEWTKEVLQRCLDAARFRYLALRLDYQLNVGPIPFVGGTHE